MKTKLLALLLLAGGSLMAGTHFSFGIGVGPGYGYYAPRYYAPAYTYYAPPPVYYDPAPIVEYRPVYPGPGYSWVSGYWFGAGPRRVWRRGYWSRGRYGYRGYGRRW
jgi:hypothetical protein